MEWNNICELNSIWFSNDLWFWVRTWKNSSKNGIANSIFSAHPLRWKLLDKQWEFGDNQWLNEFPKFIPKFNVRQSEHWTKSNPFHLCVCVAVFIVVAVPLKVTEANCNTSSNQMNWKRCTQQFTQVPISLFVDAMIAFSIRNHGLTSMSPHIMHRCQFPVHTHPQTSYLRLVVFFPFFTSSCIFNLHLDSLHLIGPLSKIS